jgi:hypothetical protein
VKEPAKKRQVKPKKPRPSLVGWRRGDGSTPQWEHFAGQRRQPSKPPRPK